MFGVGLVVSIITWTAHAALAADATAEPTIGNQGSFTAGEAHAPTTADIVQDLVETYGLSRADAEALAAQATRDVVDRGEAPVPGEREWVPGPGEVPGDMTPEEQALMTEMNERVKTLKDQGLTEQQIHETIDAEMGDRLRELAHERGVEMTKEEMERYHQDHPWGDVRGDGFERPQPMPVVEHEAEFYRDAPETTRAAPETYREAPEAQSYERPAVESYERPTSEPAHEPMEHTPPEYHAP